VKQPWLCVVELLRFSLSSSDETRQTLTRDLISAQSQLSRAKRELGAVTEKGRQQAELLTHAASTMSALAEQMNNVVSGPAAANGNNADHSDAIKVTPATADSSASSGNVSGKPVGAAAGSATTMKSVDAAATDRDKVMSESAAAAAAKTDGDGKDTTVVQKNSN